MYSVSPSRQEANLFRQSPSLGIGQSMGTPALSQQEAQPPTLLPATDAQDPSLFSDPLLPIQQTPTQQATAPAPSWPQYRNSSLDNAFSTPITGAQRGPTTAPVLRSYSMPAAPPVPIQGGPSMTPAHSYYTASPLPPAPPMVPVQRQAQSLPNVFSGVPPPATSLTSAPFQYATPPPPLTRTMPPPPPPPPMHQPILGATASAFVPAGPPAFTVTTPYGIAPTSSPAPPPLTRPMAAGHTGGYGVPTSHHQQQQVHYGNVSPRKIPPPGSAVALEAGGDSQATLVDADGANGAAPWYSKISKAVSTSISKVWSGPDQQKQQQPNQLKYATPPSNTPGYYPPYQATQPQYGTYPPTTPAAYLGMPTGPGAGSPAQMSIAIHSPQSAPMHSGHGHYSSTNGASLVKQPVPGMGTYHGFSKVHPGLRHHQQAQQQQQQHQHQGAQSHYGVRMDGPVV